MANPQEDYGNAVPLEDVLSAFKKSLARATQATSDTSKNDISYLLGKRRLFTIDALNVEINVGLRMNTVEGDDEPADRILVDFNAPEAARSKISFEVDAVPIEPVKGPKVILARSPDFRSELPENHFRIWLIGADNAPEVDYEVVLCISSQIDPEEKTIRLRTDPLGQITFCVDMATGRFLLKSGTATDPPDPENILLNPDMPWNPDRVWFLWAESDMAEEPSENFPLLRG